MQKRKLTGHQFQVIKHELETEASCWEHGRCQQGRKSYRSGKGSVSFRLQC